MMHHAQHTTRDWTPMLQQFAQDLGVADYHSGSLCFALGDGPEIVVEPIAGNSVLTVHADLGSLCRRNGDAAPDQGFARLLANNAPALAPQAFVHAIDPVDDSAILFRRLEDPAEFSYEAFAALVRDFAAAAQRESDAPDRDGYDEFEEIDVTCEAAPDVDEFRGLWADFLHARALGDAHDDAGTTPGGLIALDDGGWLLVHHDGSSNTVLIEAVLGFMPQDDLDDETLFRQLLEAHLLGEATDGANFAIDEEDQTLVAYRRLPLAGLDAQSLGDELDRLGMTAARFAQMFGIERPGAVVDAR